MKAFDPDCFSRYIFDYHGNPVVVELYQSGVWPDDEIFGTFIFDMINKRYLIINGVYLTEFDRDRTNYLDIYNEDEWNQLNEYVEEKYSKETIEFYKQKIEEFKNMTPTPEILELERPTSWVYYESEATNKKTE